MKDYYLQEAQDLASVKHQRFPIVRAVGTKLGVVRLLLC